MNVWLSRKSARTQTINQLNQFDPITRENNFNETILMNHEKTMRYQIIMLVCIMAHEIIWKIAKMVVRTMNTDVIEQWLVPI